MLVFTIIPLQKQMNHVISLQQLTETKQRISQPKVHAKLVKYIFDHRVNDHYSAKTNKTRNSITTINLNETHDISTQGNCRTRLIIVLKIILPQTPTKHVIPLWQININETKYLANQGTCPIFETRNQSCIL